MKQFREKRSGVTLIAVLVCLGVVTVILLASVASSLRQRRQLRQEIQLEQTKWLLDAGIRQVLLDFENDPKIENRTMDFSSSFPKYEVATLQINRKDSAAEGAQVTLTARMAVRKILKDSATQRSKTIVLE